MNFMPAEYTVDQVELKIHINWVHKAFAYSQHEKMDLQSINLHITWAKEWDLSTLEKQKFSQGDGLDGSVVVIGDQCFMQVRRLEKAGK